jgi:hypothetical protein
MNGWYTKCLLIAAGAGATGAGATATGTIVVTKTTFGVSTGAPALMTANGGAPAIASYVLLAAGIGLVVAGVVFAVLTWLIDRFARRDKPKTPATAAAQPAAPPTVTGNEGE